MKKWFKFATVFIALWCFALCIVGARWGFAIMAVYWAISAVNDSIEFYKEYEEEGIHGKHERKIR